VREVYAALLSANVGVKNVEHIVRTVLNKLGGVKVGRLFIIIVMDRLCCVALLQICCIALFHNVYSLVIVFK
jgi:signal recognition particle GTPase